MGFERTILFVSILYHFCVTIQPMSIFGSYSNNSIRLSYFVCLIMHNTFFTIIDCFN